MQHTKTAGLACLALVASLSVARAESIVQDLTNSTVSLNGNAFGQSFTATGTALDRVTVYVADFNPFLGQYALRLDLYQGVGYGGPLLATRTEVLPDGFGGAWRVSLAGVMLAPGAQYSIRVSSASGRGGIQINQHAFPGGGAINVDYPGGNLLTGAGGVANPIFDLRFQVDFEECLASIIQDLTNSTVSLNGNAFGQSFRPIHPRLDAVTVFLADFNSFLGAYDIRVEVFAGVGYAGAPIFSSVQSLPNGFAGGLSVALGGLAVTPGAPYSIRVSSASGRGGIQLNQHSFPGGGPINVDYPGGDLLTGAGGVPNPIFDLRFRVDGHAAGQLVEQPNTNSTVSLNGNAFGQTFVAVGSNLETVTTFVADFNPFLGAYALRLDLYAGAGYGGALLATHTDTLGAGFSGAWSVDVGAALVPGNTYSLRVSSASGRGGIQLNQHSFPGGGAINADYPGGDLLTGAGGTPNPIFDLRFTLEFGQMCVLEEGPGGLTAVCGDDTFPVDDSCQIVEYGDGVTVRCPEVCFNAPDECPDDPAKILPGGCGCGVADDDSDGDGALDCQDGCPADGGKTAPGICGCGVADTDGDRDGVADCRDACPRDGGKVEPGICGCGVADADNDGDGVADCVDGCPDDPEKQNRGACGCGKPDDDSDRDGTPDCIDDCPGDPDKIVPGICDCGRPDTDSDRDGAADCVDDCPQDPNKVGRGACGCGVADADGDGDGVPDCIDACPGDPGKTAPGICGCGRSDADSDRDGAVDCVDGCPADPAKVDSGVCGCGVVDSDRDGDGAPDCVDGCPMNPAKVDSGICGCGAPDTDSDGDGEPDCFDKCPADPAKIADGVCGCGVADTDGDGDGTADCVDACPADPNKVEPGACDCGTPDGDRDGDGVPDCLDGCPDDGAKTEGGACGCGTPDTDADGDGTADCFDECPDDEDKLAPGLCGCGVPDGDADGDGVIDCFDGCPDDADKAEGGICGCGVPDVDRDRDGAADCVDFCADDPDKVDFGVCGCHVPDVDGDGDGTADCVDFCVDDPNKVDFGICGCHVADVDRDGDGDVDGDDCVFACAGPVADAGDDVTRCDTTVTLDASGSQAACGGAIFTWREDDLSLGAGADLTVELAPGVHVLTLTVCDANGACDDDDVTVSVGRFGRWAYPNEISVAEAYNRLYCDDYLEDDRCGLAELASDRAVEYPDTFTTDQIAEVQVLAYDTSVSGRVMIEVVGGGQLLVFDPGPWTPPTRGWLPDAGSPTVDLAQLLVANGYPADSAFRFKAGGRTLGATNAYLIRGAEQGEWLIGYNDGGLRAGDADANEPVLLVMAPIDARLEACPAGYNVIVGTNGDDVLIGTPGPDCIYGLGGNDDLRAGAGDDLIFGGRGNDTVNAALGNDYVSGGTCHDNLRGREGMDTLDGGPGNDILRGGADDDLLRGGDGDDTVGGDAGNDTVMGDAGDDIVVGSDGDDRVFGGDGDDDVRGGNGNDELFGEAGDDRIQGDKGDDLLDGGPGVDVLNGGANRDTCVAGETLLNCEL